MRERPAGSSFPAAPAGAGSQCRNINGFMWWCHWLRRSILDSISHQ
jgi:hypothetical protein